MNILFLLPIIFTILVGISVNQTAYAADMAYEDKLSLNQGLEEITSHLNASKENFEQGRFYLAMMHLTHPIDEGVFDKLPISKISDKNYVDKLELMLFILKNTSMDISSENYYAQISLIEKTITEGKNIKAHSVIDNHKIQFETVVYLLDYSKIEYAEGLEIGGTIEDNIELQDSYALTELSETILKNLETIHQKGDIFDQNFADIFTAYEDTATSIEIDTIKDKIISEINSIEIPETTKIDFREIPEWIKNIALWWATGEVSDAEFLQAIQYLINQGTITVNEK